MINLLLIKAGQELDTKDGRKATVVENLNDGQWLEVQFADGDEVEMLHAQQIARVVESAG